MRGDSDGGQGIRPFLIVVVVSVGGKVLLVPAGLEVVCLFLV